MSKEKLKCGSYDCDDETLFVNGNIPYVSYDGLSILQHHKVYDVFYNFISQYKPKRILEIGTAYGGLSLLLRDILDELHLEDCEFWTIDVAHYNHFEEKISDKNIKYIIKNFFNHDYSDFVDGEDLIKFIQDEGSTLVLCDGGSKIKEFNLISKFLKHGDIIMAHDYAKNRAYFDENIYNKVWYWLEILESDIERVCDQEGLVDYFSEEFNNVAWVCKMKIINNIFMDENFISNSENELSSYIHRDEDKKMLKDIFSYIEFILHKNKKI